MKDWNVYEVLSRAISNREIFQHHLRWHDYTSSIWFLNWVLDTIGFRGKETYWIYKRSSGLGLMQYMLEVLNVTRQLFPYWVGIIRGQIGDEGTIIFLIGHLLYIFHVFLKHFFFGKWLKKRKKKQNFTMIGDISAPSFMRSSKEMLSISLVCVVSKLLICLKIFRAKIEITQRLDIKQGGCDNLPIIYETGFTLLRIARIPEVQILCFFLCVFFKWK